MFSLGRLLGVTLMLASISQASAVEPLKSAPVTLQTVSGEVVVDALLEAVY